MLLSYVLRLVPGALAEGRLAGTVEAVQTGETTAFGSVDELLRALLPRPRAPHEGEGEGVTIDLRDAQRARTLTERPDAGR